MLSIGRLFGLIVLFLFFEVVVFVLGTVLLPDVNVLLVCAAFTGLALAVWVVYMLVNRWMSRPHAPAPPAPAPAPPAVLAALPTAETADLKTLIREAEDRLAASPAFVRKGAKPRLDRLPIYLVAGPTGSGKTSSLANSGLDPRLLAGESHRDGIVVSTRLCNIWYAGDAAWIDVSGRLFDDEAAWRGLLTLLTGREKKSFLRRLWEGHSTSQNIRGIILFCDANTFLRSPDPQQISALSRRIQERLQTVGQVIGTEFPVYTVLAKSDAIPFFGDFFNQLSEQEDRQVLGFTLPSGDSTVKTFGEVYNEAENRRLSDYWTRLYQSLSDKRLTFLGRESTAEKKPFIYEFPREVKRIRAEVVRFLVDTFRPNPLHPGAQLRGFYFSGIRKVASTKSAERLGEQTHGRVGGDATVLFRASDLPQALAVTGTRRPVVAQQEVTVSRWVFLSELFHRIVLADRSLAPVVSIDRRTQQYRYLAFGSLAVLGLGLALAFTTSWVNNRRLLEDVREATRNAKAADSQPLSLENLQSMESIRTRLALLTGYEREGPPWRFRWGLYTGDEALADLRRLYFSRFRQAFLEPSLIALRTQFIGLNPAAASGSYEDIYDRLKVYRTITSGACKPEQAVLSRVLPGLALGGHALDPQSDELAQRQINFYISELLAEDPYEKKIEENAAAREQAQAYLQSFKGPEQLYRGLIGGVSAEVPAAKLESYAPGYAQVLTGPTQVAGAFTRQGWDKVEQKIHDGNFGATGESCVVGGNRFKGAVQGFESRGDVQNLYVNGYIQAWRDFLSQQGIQRYRDLADASQKLGVLSDSRSPMLGALLMIGEHTNFPPAQTGAANPAEQKVASSIKSKFGSIFSRAKKAQDLGKAVLPPAGAQLSQADIYNVFQPVRTVKNPASKERLVDDSNRNYINALAELKTALDTLPREKGANPDNALIETVRRASEKAHGSVRELTQRFNIASAKGTDGDLTRYLELPIESTDRLIPAPLDPSAKVNGQMKLVCDSLRVLERKYPFNPRADSETTIPELVRLFAPNTGLIWSFQALPAPLTNLFVPAGDQWMQNPAIQQPKLTPEFVDFFNRMAHISTALFAQGPTTPHLQYTVQPMSSEGVQTVTLTVDGTTSSTGQPMAFTWPSPSGSSSVEMKLTNSGFTVPFGHYEGPWAIFRLMDDAEPRQRGQNVYVFRKLRQGHGLPQEATSNGAPVSVRVMITFTGGFDPRNFNSTCPRIAAQ